MCKLTCLKNPCFCWNEEVYEPSEDTWFLWEVIEGLPYIGGLGVEIGCGSGALLNVISKKVDKVIGVDLMECATKACKSCGFEVVRCNSMSCLREGDLVVSNLPYLPCDDDMATCDRWAQKVLKFLRVKRDGLLVLLYSSLTSFDVLGLVKGMGFSLLKIDKRSLGFEELIVIVLRKVR